MPQLDTVKQLSFDMSFRKPKPSSEIAMQYLRPNCCRSVRAARFVMPSLVKKSQLVKVSFLRLVMCAM